MDLTTGLINARGLGDKIKRREFFNWLPKKQRAMYFIQEAHCTENYMHDSRVELNGVIRSFLTAALVKRQVLSYCLTILSPLKSREHTATLGTLYKL